VTPSPLATPNLSPRVLVVDGDSDNRELYRESLTLAGWHVAEACDGREALVLALKSTPWVVVTELRLPLIDGVALCEILRRDRATAAVPILVVTSETRLAELARATRAGADAVLIKPSTPDVVVSELRRLVERPPAADTVAPPLPSPAGRRTILVKAHQRVATTTPPDPPAELNCPICGHRLRYEQTYIGGVNSRHPERWDYFACVTCGQFQYRYRTRKLRQL
jgi:CheY-like chemotaxis protein